MKAISTPPNPQSCRMVYLSERPPAEAPEMLAGYPDLLTVQHVHEITGVSEQVIRKEVAEGRLCGGKIGRRIFVPKFKLIEHMVGGGPDGD